MVELKASQTNPRFASIYDARSQLLRWVQRGSKIRGGYLFKLSFVTSIRSNSAIRKAPVPGVMSIISHSVTNETNRAWIVVQGNQALLWSEHDCHEQRKSHVLVMP